MLAIIIRPGGNVAARDLHPRDACVGKHDAEEGQAVGVRRGRDEAAEEQITVGIRSIQSTCWGRSRLGRTSVKTAPKPVTVAGTVPPLSDRV